jgi:hypothetical protein
MPQVGQIQISGLMQGSPAPGSTFPPYYIPLAAGIPVVQEITLAIGNNTITVPTGTSVALIVPPNYAFPTPLTGYTGILTLKGVGGDTGFPIDKVMPTLLSIDGTSFVLNSTTTGSLVVWSA